MASVREFHARECNGIEDINALNGTLTFLSIFTGKEHPNIVKRLAATSCIFKAIRIMNWHSIIESSPLGSVTQQH
jgi:hypothetical protein